MTKRLAHEEGIFAGTSTGGNVVVALGIAEQLPAHSIVVTIMCDTGMKYLSKIQVRSSSPKRVKQMSGML